jgi:hypothetical protein
MGDGGARLERKDRTWFPLRPARNDPARLLIADWTPWNRRIEHSSLDLTFRHRTLRPSPDSGDSNGSLADN